MCVHMWEEGALFFSGMTMALALLKENLERIPEESVKSGVFQKCKIVRKKNNFPNCTVLCP